MLHDLNLKEDLEKLHNQFYAMGQEVLTNQPAPCVLLSHMTVTYKGSHRRWCRSKWIRSEIGKRNHLKWQASQRLFRKVFAPTNWLPKAVSDLERAGDHAVSIAKAAIRRAEGEQRNPAVEWRDKKTGRDVKIFAWSCPWSLPEWLCRSSLWSKASWVDEKINCHFDTSAPGYGKKSRKILKPSLQAVITSRLFLLGTYRRLCQKHLRMGRLLWNG